MSVADHSETDLTKITDIDDLSLYFAKRITSKHNQHAIVMFVGPAGSGKSIAAVALARGVSRNVAEILKDGTPNDYFNFQETFATISKDEVKRVMTNPKKYAILLLDDPAAYAMNARKYREEDNIDLNSELTTFRPNNNLVIMTMVAGFLIDKVPRSLSHFIIEMEQAYFDDGFTIAKVKQVVYNHSKQKLMFPYLQSGAQKYVRHVFPAPSQEDMVEYEKMRAFQLKRASEKKTEATEKIKPPSISDIMIDTWISLHKDGWSYRDIARPAHVSHTTVMEALQKAGVVN
jgi:energy-coupling factor transporter ATP-binding protein EcfA2